MVPLLCDRIASCHGVLCVVFCTCSIYELIYTFSGLLRSTTCSLSLFIFMYVTCRIMAEAKTKKGSRVYLRWTPEMDTALLAMLVEHHKRGDHVQNGWKPHGYNACIKHVKETRDLVINNDKIIARIKTFDKQYDIIIKMLAQSGFGWDWENNMVMVESDEVWLRYVEANKDATFYRNKEVKN